MLQNNDPISIKRKNNGGCVFNCKRFHLESESISVKISGEIFRQFDFQDMGEQPYMLGHVSGTVKTDIARNEKIQVRRELFVADDGQIAAMRFIVKNISRGNIRFNGINPIEILNEKSFAVAEANMSAWKMLRYPFHKSDIPCYFKPSVADNSFEDAVFSCVGAVPGQGVVYNRINSESRTVSSGPLLIIGNGDNVDAQKLMLCTTGIEKHFIEMLLTTSDDRQSLKEFKVECNFDGIELKTGDAAGMHWLLIAPGKNESDLIGVYADTVAGIYNLPPVKSPPPTVYCTWYFYTFNFNETYLKEELDTIAEKNIPVDVFQIDDGWMDNYGSYEADPVKFPNGMKAAADMIKKHGITPGIWACPFVIEVDSPVIKKYPDLMQRDENGEPIIYDTSINDCYVLDPTAPGAVEYLTSLLTKLKSWGYTYFKLDWLRAIYEFDTVRFRDPSVNRAMAYLMAMKVIREVLGPDCYICACGGLSDPGNLGLVDSQRTCKDVRGVWHGAEDVGKSGVLVNFKQNILRSYTNRFYHSDPDGSHIRIRKERFFENERKCVGVYQSEGHYTDEEAFTIMALQYVCGGLVMLSERFPELHESRIAILRNVAPSCGINPARILDFDNPACPSMFLNKITPKCSSLGNWWTLTLGNWEDEDIVKEVSLDYDMIPAENRRFAVFEFYTQEFFGLFDRADMVKLLIPAHGTRVLRLTPWDGDSPRVLGTDLHITGGGYEITACDFAGDKISGSTSNPWQYPVAITAGFPDEDGIKVTRKTINSDDDFTITMQA